MTDQKPTVEQPIHIVQITSAVFLVVMLGWLVVVGKSLLLPILIGVISVYILTTSAEALTKFPIIGGASQRLRRILVGVLFLIIMLALINLIAANTQAITEAAPRYGENFNNLLEQIARDFDLKRVPNFETLMTRLQSNYSVSDLIGDLVGGLTGAGAFLASAFLYAAFLLADWNDLPNKTRLALGSEANTQAILQTVRNINSRIGGYLMSKTLINIILGVVSYVVMLLIGIEFAVFWAILIGLLNYIPYLGSILGVLFPVALALVQFGSLKEAGIAFVALMAAQLYVGNVLEPKMLGRSVNMSPFIFMVALSFWMSVWGLIGAILAIPLTSMIMIILAEIPRTRPIAVMMSGDGQV